MYARGPQNATCLAGERLGKGVCVCVCVCVCVFECARVATWPSCEPRAHENERTHALTRSNVCHKTQNVWQVRDGGAGVCLCASCDLAILRAGGPCLEPGRAVPPLEEVPRPTPTHKSRDTKCVRSLMCVWVIPMTLSAHLHVRPTWGCMYVQMSTRNRIESTTIGE